MFVYVWKDSAGVPFYVGMGSTMYRANPKSYSSRNKSCRIKMKEIGVDNVVVEIFPQPSADAAIAKERALIAALGTLRSGTGPLCNISEGGEYHAVAPETKERLKQVWQDPEFRERQKNARTGVKRMLSESTKTKLRNTLAANPEMRSWGERNGQDPEFDAKRIAGIKAAQPKRREKMQDPAALAQRKARLAATLNSPEHKARRAAQNTPEYRAQQSAKLKASWQARKARSAT